MIGAGLDLSFSWVRAVVVQLARDGTTCLLEAFSFNAADFPERANQVLASLSRHRPLPFTKLPVAIAVSHPDAKFERMKIALPADASHITTDTLREWFLAGQLPVPNGDKLAEDYWDIRISRLYRRAADVERLGQKTAELIFTRVPGSLASPPLPQSKHIRIAGVLPSGLSILEAHLKMDAPASGEKSLILGMGTRNIRAILADGGELLGSANISLEDMAAQVAKNARIEPRRAAERIANMDVMASDAASSTVRAALTRALQHVQQALWPEDSSPKPSRAILCGGLATLRGMSRLVNAATGIPADPISQPAKLRAGLVLPGPFPAFAAATGAALRAAGLYQVAVNPRPRGAALPERRGRMGLARLKALGERLAALGHSGYSAITGIKNLPRRMGWGWVALGLAALLAVFPTAWAHLKIGNALVRLERERQELAPEVRELRRQADLIDQYVRMSGTAALSRFPWDEVIVEVAAKMPRGVYVSNLNANAERLLIAGRVRGDLDRQLRIIEGRLRNSPVLKRNGLSPPER